MYENYQNPLIERYSSEEMLKQFSPMKKFSTWRKLWIALAESEKELGLNITDLQIEEMKKNIYNIDFKRAAEFEKEVRHDVMAHVHAFGEQCPNAMPIIHLGATSAYVGDNTDLIVMKEALGIVKRKLAVLIDKLGKFAEETKAIPTLGFTHYQPAQLTTVGKRATLWLMDLVMDYEDVCILMDQMKMRGVKGTTGTQASYLNLFDNDHTKVSQLDEMVAIKMGFKETLAVTGQTYTRKIDAKVLGVLSGVAMSLHKMTNDLRLLQSLKEIEEPFEKKQIGSSAMAYKRNPMRSERISSLCKYVISLASSPQLVAATQWFERTLDDSANKRLAIPEGFLAIDACLDIANNVTTGLVVYEKVIEKHVMAELPFMATENIIMEAVKKGGDRQIMHESIRVHSMEAGRMVKELGLENDLLERISKDPSFNLSDEDIKSLLNPTDYIGRSPEQVDAFIIKHVMPIREAHASDLGTNIALKV
ncbi:adenylosuccinate lyase [Fusibacter ferrireducens]|uniref:Adenylosuccinate lyase n=1 Tax=Fusibacter ferrireducens TaxID=2785058 RepID=A0ABR9ZMY4_9FIRM|nr:adenylosuccinate lyase [Fusibacter ferrireducens]MBF4691796.1 adenylosuccinate lyase [Fusibacter ferrireducens]